MNNAKIITYNETAGKAAFAEAPIDSFAIFQNSTFIGYRHASDMPYALRADRSVFVKTKEERKRLSKLKLAHKHSGAFNPYPKTVITITQ